MFQNQVNLFVVLHHRNDGAAELGGQNDRFDVAIVLEPVAHDDAVGRILGDGHYREEFGFGADLESEAELFAVAVDLFDHEALLIDLDGEHRRVAVLVVVFRNGRAKGFRKVA